MKKKNMQDERIIAQRRKINSEAFGILWIALLLSVIIQQYFLDAHVEQYAVELICFIGVSIYMIVRQMILGLNLYGEGKRAKSIPLINSIVTGITTTAINGVLNHTRYAEHYNDGKGYFIAMLAIFFISVTLSTFFILSLFDYLNKKKQAKIEKSLNENEEDIVDE